MSFDPRDHAPKGRDEERLPRAGACPRCELREPTSVCRLCKAEKALVTKFHDADLQT